MHRLRRKLIEYFKVPPLRKQYFDENLNREQWDLLEASALLQVTEFRIFELSYKEWYGAAPKARVIEVHFRNYMFNQIIPVWVSHFCRGVIEKDRAGVLNPKDYGVYHRLPSKRMRRIGQAYAAMLLVAFLVLLYMTYGDTLFPNFASSLFGRGDAYDLPQHNTMP